MPCSTLRSHGKNGIVNLFLVVGEGRLTFQGYFSLRNMFLVPKRTSFSFIGLIYFINQLVVLKKTDVLLAFQLASKKAGISKEIVLFLVYLLEKRLFTQLGSCLKCLRYFRDPLLFQPLVPPVSSGCSSRGFYLEVSLALPFLLHHYH